MTHEQREKLKYITGVLTGLSYMVDGNAADAIVDLVQDMDKVLEEDQQQHG